MLGGSVLPDTEEGDPEEEFELLDLLGQGAYGSVSKALHTKTGVTYAVKILSASSPQELNAIKKEIQILRHCCNEHIVKYYGTYFKDNNLWIVLEYCHAGSIIDLLNITQKKLTQYEIASILQSVLHGLIYLHSHKKIHRDIKAANILLNKEGLAKLADFGVSTESTHSNAGHRSQVGSPYWMSPEVMKHSEYTNKTDIWSLGVTAIELAQGVVPNSNLKPLIAMWQLKDKPVQGLKQPSKWSPEFNSFVKECLSINPCSRPEAKTLIEHPFLVKFSRGQSLIAELVQQSLTEIEKFRGQDWQEDSEYDILGMLNQSGAGETKTIVNRTERSREQQCEALESSMLSMVINDSVVINDSMVVNEEESSSVEGREKPSSAYQQFLAANQQMENEQEQQKQQMRTRVQQYDTACLSEMHQLFQKHKQTMTQMLEQGLNREFIGLDPQFITGQLGSRLYTATNLYQFLHTPQSLHHSQTQTQSQKAKEQETQTERLFLPESKEFERSDLAKRKTACHNSTQTNEPSSGDLPVFTRECQSRGVRSQEFPEREFRTTQKHEFNSKSIISDMANVKESKDFQHYDDSRSKIAGRFVFTEPYDWGCDPRPKLEPEDRARLRQQFFEDPDVKQSIMSHLQAAGKSEKSRFDRIVAESTLYHDWAEESAGLKQHQNSMTMMKGNSQQRNHHSEQEYLLPHEQFEDQDTEINVNLFNPKSSVKLSKNPEPNKNLKKAKGKRIGMSAEKKGRANYSSGTAHRKHPK